MNERIKQIRQHFNLTQKSFGGSLGVSRDVFANIENNRVEPSKTFIQLLCATYGINEDWLRTGRGQMLIETDESIVEEVANEYELGAFDKEILKIFLGFSPEQQQTLKNFAFSLVDAVLNNNELYTEYRNAYIGKNAMPYAARNGQPGDMEELINDFDHAEDGGTPDK